jgi:hypothetical protein
MGMAVRMVVIPRDRRLRSAFRLPFSIHDDVVLGSALTRDPNCVRILPRVFKGSHISQPARLDFYLVYGGGTVFWRGGTTTIDNCTTAAMEHTSD